MGERKLSHRMGTDAWASSFQDEVRKLEDENEQLESDNSRMRPVFEATVRWSGQAKDWGDTNGPLDQALLDAVKEARSGE